MPVQLNPLEARVIACLIEKEIATPEQYPLSLNALTNACNQKSNRDPVMDLDEATVQQTLDGLERRFLVSSQTGYGSRVSKYHHRFCNTHFGGLKFSPRELAIVCELLLRGPQTPGELRSRATRLAPFGDVGEVEQSLDGLARREDGPFVVRLAREPGRRDSRYAHCFGDTEVDADETDRSAPPHDSATRPSADDPGRLLDLETRLANLEAEVAALRELVQRNSQD